MEAINPTVFKAYDIRGIVDKDFDPKWVQKLGQACGTWFLKQGYAQAVVGHDCRHSSSCYQQALIQGLLSTGVNVVFINMVATPIFYFAVKYLDYQAGVIITASHNPSEYNGFKIWGGKSTIHTQDIQDIYQIMCSDNFAQGKGIASELDIIPAYLENLSAQTKLSQPVKIVVDGGNGSGGQTCAELLRRVGAEVIELYCEPDGNFPNHHPDPTIKANMIDLQAEVVKQGVDLGVGLDGDADRIGVVDEQGQIIYGDQLLAIFARQVLQQNPAATIIGEVKCSHLLYQDIALHGGQPIMYKAGHSLIKAKMQETGALLAGEMSGHIFFADRFFGFDDALYAAQRLVEILAEKNQPLSQFLTSWPKTYNTPEIRMDCPAGHKFKIMDKAIVYFKSRYAPPVFQDVDGVRLNFEDGWALIRASNTQSILVLRFEAQSETRLQELRKLVEEPLQGWIAAAN